MGPAAATLRLPLLLLPPGWLLLLPLPRPKLSSQGSRAVGGSVSTGAQAMLPRARKKAAAPCWGSSCSGSDGGSDGGGSGEDGKASKARYIKAAAAGGPLRALARKDASTVSRLHGARKKGDDMAADGSGGEPVARDFDDWKRKHGVPLDAKVFSMTGW